MTRGEYPRNPGRYHDSRPHPCHRHLCRTAHGLAADRIGNGVRTSASYIYAVPELLALPPNAEAGSAQNQAIDGLGSGVSLEVYANRASCELQRCRS